MTPGFSPPPDEQAAARSANAITAPSPRPADRVLLRAVLVVTERCDGFPDSTQEPYVAL
jgi:hypothetical protein